MTWNGFTIDNEFYDLKHLQTASYDIEIDGSMVKLQVSYANHCFTDKKENGPMLFKREGRYWSPERYSLSLTLPTLIESNLINSYAIPFTSKNGESYHYSEQFDYAIFFSISKPAGTDNELKMRVNSAYEVDEWGKSTLPKGKKVKVSWILSQRLKGQSALKKK